MSIDDYRTLTGSQPDFKAWLLGGPKFNDFPLECSRGCWSEDRDLTRGRRYLLDTNVLSGTRKSRMDPNVSDFLEGLDTLGLFISVLTIGEFRRRVEIKMPPIGSPSGSVRPNRITLIVSCRSMSRSRIWGSLFADRTRPVVETMIAATAVVHGLVLVTRNIKDVKGLDMLVVDPWTTSHRLRKP